MTPTPVTATAQVRRCQSVWHELITPTHHDLGELEDHDLGLSHDLPQIVDRNSGARAGAACSGIVGRRRRRRRWPAAATTTSPRRPTPRPSRPRARAGRVRRPAVAVRSRRCARRRVRRRGRRRRDPRGDGRTLPGRRLQRGQRAHRVAASSAATSPPASAGVRRRRGRAAHRQAAGLRPQRRRRHAARRRRGLPVALRPRGQLLAVLRRRSPRRTTCAASRRPTRTASLEFTTIFPACYAGRWPHMHFEVYESLATPPTLHEQAAHLAARPARRTSATRSTRPRATSSSVANLAAVASTATGSSPTATPAAGDGHRLRRRGLRASLNVPV